MVPVGIDKWGGFILVWGLIQYEDVVLPVQEIPLQR